MQELRSKEFSSPGVQELRSLAGARSAAGGQEFLSPTVQEDRSFEDSGSGGQQFMGSAVEEARSS